MTLVKLLSSHKMEYGVLLQTKAGIIGKEADEVFRIFVSCVTSTLKYQVENRNIEEVRSFFMTPVADVFHPMLGRLSNSLTTRLIDRLGFSHGLAYQVREFSFSFLKRKLEIFHMEHEVKVDDLKVLELLEITTPLRQIKRMSRSSGELRVS